jgi:hypothetical protein
VLEPCLQAASSAFQSAMRPNLHVSPRSEVRPK